MIIGSKAAVLDAVFQRVLSVNVGEISDIIPVGKGSDAIRISRRADGGYRNQASPEAKQGEHFSGYIRQAKQLSVVRGAAIARLANHKHAIDTHGEVHKPGRRKQVRKVDGQVLPPVVISHAVGIGDSVTLRVARNTIVRLRK